MAQLQWDNNQYAYAKKDTNEKEAVGEKFLNLSLKEMRTEEAIAERENKLKKLGFTINNDPSVKTVQEELRELVKPPAPTKEEPSDTVILNENASGLAQVPAMLHEKSKEYGKQLAEGWGLSDKDLSETIPATDNDGTNQQLEITQEQKRLDTEGATNQSQEEQSQI